MAAKVREKIKLVSTGKTAAGRPTKFYYTTVKNKRNTTDKLQIKKFDPRAFDENSGKVGTYVLFKEDKIK